MPDIAMCKNESCSMKQTCYRFKAKPDRIQSYASFIENDPDGGCDAYIGMDKFERRKIYL